MGATLLVLSDRRVRLGEIAMRLERLAFQRFLQYLNGPFKVARLHEQCARCQMQRPVRRRVGDGAAKQVGGGAEILAGRMFERLFPEQPELPGGGVASLGRGLQPFEFLQRREPLVPAAETHQRRSQCIAGGLVGRVQRDRLSRGRFRVTNA